MIESYFLNLLLLGSLGWTFNKMLGLSGFLLMMDASLKSSCVPTFLIDSGVAVAVSARWGHFSNRQVKSPSLANAGLKTSPLSKEKIYILFHI